MSTPEERPAASIPPGSPAADEPLRPIPDGARGDDGQPPHPPFARDSDEYTDPPGHHRRGPDGPALDVGA